MIRTIVLGVAALTASTAAVLAADLPSRRSPPVFVEPPVPIISWTGLYVGGQVGYGFGKDADTLALVGLSATIFSHPHGVIGGAHVGYNFSTQSLGLPVLSGGGLVVGVEGDVDGSDYSDTVNSALASLGLHSNIQESARGRLGIAFDRALFYATGGAAFAQFKETYSGPGFFDAGSHNRVGYTVGGGVEYAITTQLSLRAEYRYSDFGTFRDELSSVITLDRHETMQRAQVGFSYKFDTPVIPVVARY